MNSNAQKDKKRNRVCPYVFLFMIFLISCYRLTSDLSLENKFELLANKMRSDTTEITFQLDKMTTFSRDTAIIITPYYQVDKLESELKFNLTEIRNTGIESNDGINVLAFIQHGILINYVVLPRSKGDFSDINDSNRISTKNKCSFKMIKSNQKLSSGQINIQIIPK
jgi:hypothetical protein